MTRPPLYKVYEDVHTRLTIGQMLAHWHTNPIRTNPTPATINPRSFCCFDLSPLSHSPVRSPMSMVASVGMKLRVDHPPSLKTKGCSRGKRLRNQTSNAHERLEFLFQCERKPL